MTKILRRLEGNTWNTWGIVDIIDDHGTEVLGSDTNGGVATVDKASVVATGVLASDLGGMTSAQVTAAINAARVLTPTAAKAGAYTAAAGDLVLADTTSAAFAITLPSAPADKTQVGVKVIGGTVVAGLLANALTITAGGTDHFNTANGSTSLTVTTLRSGFLVQYVAATGVWIPIPFLDPAQETARANAAYVPQPASALTAGQMYGSDGAGNTVAVNPAELAYAENATGVTQAIASSATAGGGNFTAVTNCQIVVPASTRPVYIEASATVSFPTAPAALAAVTVEIVEVSNGVDTPITWSTNVPVSSQGQFNSVTVNFLARRLGTTARTRTFNLMVGDYQVALSVLNSTQQPSRIAAFAR